MRKDDEVLDIERTLVQFNLNLWDDALLRHIVQVLLSDGGEAGNFTPFRCCPIISDTEVGYQVYDIRSVDPSGRFCPVIVVIPLRKARTACYISCIEAF